MAVTTYLAVPSGQLGEVWPGTSNLINYAYKIGRGFHLYRTNLPANYRGGIMGVGEIYVGNNYSPGIATSEILRECRIRGYTGVFLDVAPRYEPVLKMLLASLVPAAAARDIRVYVPEALAELSGEAVVVISTALSGGSLNDRLEEALAAYGPGRLGLDVELLRMDFALPAFDGKGETLSEEQLQRLRGGRMTFFSRELCANYFSYSANGKAHFVVFDTAATLERKLQIADKMGIRTAFFLYPEIRGIYRELFGQG